MVPMRVLEKLQKNLAFVLALLLALSSFGGAPALAWVHTDGSACSVCPLGEPVAAPADSCCAPDEPVVSTTDCQICCEAKGHEQSQRRVLPASAAVLAEQPALAQLFQIQRQALSTQRTLARQAPLHCPPSLRAPPSSGLPNVKRLT